jgi:hypothetical protein
LKDSEFTTKSFLTKVPYSIARHAVRKVLENNAGALNPFYLRIQEISSGLGLDRDIHLTFGGMLLTAYMYKRVMFY